MMKLSRTLLLTMLLFCFCLQSPLHTFAQAGLMPGTQPLTWQGDLAAKMVAGIDSYFMRMTDQVASERSQYWNRDFSSHVAYVKSIRENRERFKTIIGVVDSRVPVQMELEGTVSVPALIGKGAGYDIFAVRWQVMRGIDGEGLLLEPAGEISGNAIALPDCDWAPELLAGLIPGIPADAQFARRLAENGFRVLIPTLIDRKHTYSGIPELKRFSNIPHREYIYRGAYELGRHIIGYEVQKVLAAVDWFLQTEERAKTVGVIGYGEGGLIALYAAAADERIDAAAVLGYFQPREKLWNEPLYRNVWSLLREFGDAEIASLVAPRPLIIEACKTPEIVIPLQRPNRSNAAPGVITTPPLTEVEREVARANRLIDGLRSPSPVRLIQGGSSPGSDEALSKFTESLGSERALNVPGKLPQLLHPSLDPEPRHKRQFQQLIDDTQYLMRESEFRREEFWSKADATSPQTWKESTKWYRDYFWDEIIGRLPVATLPPNVRTRQIYETPKFTGYEVALDVYPDVFAYGIILIPKDIVPGERRPVVVCQHGLEGRPQDVANPADDNPAYHMFACQLADRGFITYAPQNPYIGWDDFRVLIRKSHPLKQSLYAVIVRQHERTLEWLSSLPYVDASRIGFYGLSYGGKTAMRIPSILENYCLSICSADYNEWIWKNVSNRHKYSYMQTVEYDMYEFNLGNTLNYAEMSWLVCPRPFMVERGHHDGVAPDEWVAYEYAKTQRRFDLLGIGDRTRIEFFTGPHTIHGVGTFEFLHKHLNWKVRE